jgi:hypothetical protein
MRPDGVEGLGGVRREHEEPCGGELLLDALEGASQQIEALEAGETARVDDRRRYVLRSTGGGFG